MGPPIKVVEIRFNPAFLTLTSEHLSEQDFGLCATNISPYLDLVPDENTLFDEGYMLCTIKDISGEDTTRI
jgi:hypothetical protein